jgi:hypothetical protein
MMTSSGGFSSGEAPTLASFYAELRALREDIKILLDNQRESKRRAYGISKEGNSVDVKVFNGVSETGSSSTEDALRDLRGEMTSLKNTLHADLHQIADSFRACMEGSNPLPGAASLRSQPTSPPGAKDAAENHSLNFQELADMVKSKVRPPTPSHAQISVH